ncbi:hypothetical protein CLOP_g12404 [Closterium sp. NIES-67]|nr:hypothetical protein CLOP_g12404 [Closterium sp. NIES-67]
MRHKILCQRTTVTVPRYLHTPYIFPSPLPVVCAFIAQNCNLSIDTRFSNGNAARGGWLQSVPRFSAQHFHPPPSAPI